jgi:predicted transcriptional regulator
VKLGDWLAENEMNATQFAALIGCRESTVSMYLNGKRMPQHAIMQKIMEATGNQVTADDMFAARMAARTGAAA